MTETRPGPAVLVLEDGRVFRGETFGAHGQALGEGVFALIPTSSAATRKRGGPSGRTT